MRLRRKKDIEKAIEEHERWLTNVIDESLSREKTEAEVIRRQEKFLRELRAEPCFEDTFEGKVEKFEGIAFDKIEAILRELSEVTGKEYLKKRSLEELFGVKDYVD